MKIHFFVSGNYENVIKALGALRVTIANLKKLANPQEFKFLGIENFLLYEKAKDDEKIKSLHHHFVNWKKLNRIQEKKPQAYDLVLNDYKIGGDSIRNHDWNKQEKNF